VHHPASPDESVRPAAKGHDPGEGFQQGQTGAGLGRSGGRGWTWYMAGSKIEHTMNRLGIAVESQALAAGKPTARSSCGNLTGGGPGKCQPRLFPQAVALVLETVGDQRTLGRLG
jgi:hypothetical protein